MSHATAGAMRPPAELTDALRAAGLRRTSPRIAVLQRLEAATASDSSGEGDGAADTGASG